MFGSVGRVWWGGSMEWNGRGGKKGREGLSLCLVDSAAVFGFLFIPAPLRKFCIFVTVTLIYGAPLTNKLKKLSVTNHSRREIMSPPKTDSNMIAS